MRPNVSVCVSMHRSTHRQHRWDGPGKKAGTASPRTAKQNSARKSRRTPLKVKPSGARRNKVKQSSAVQSQARSYIVSMEMAPRTRPRRIGTGCRATGRRAWSPCRRRSRRRGGRVRGPRLPRAAAHSQPRGSCSATSGSTTCATQRLSVRVTALACGCVPVATHPSLHGRIVRLLTSSVQRQSKGKRSEARQLADGPPAGSERQQRQVDLAAGVR